MRAIRIGITGKLGSGKSLLVRVMEEHGIACVRSDDLARELMEHDAALREDLIRILGPEAYANGTLDRKFVASKIFNDTALRRTVEAAVHPRTTAEVERIFDQHPDEMVAVESALILQTQFYEAFDYIILVEAPDDAAIERVVKEGRLTREDAARRLAEQANDPTDRAEVDFTLDNSGTVEEFHAKCERLIAILDALKGRELPEKALHRE